MTTNTEDVKLYLEHKSRSEVNKYYKKHVSSHKTIPYTTNV